MFMTVIPEYISRVILNYVIDKPEHKHKSKSTFKDLEMVIISKNMKTLRALSA